jgi:hypothetical protein
MDIAGLTLALLRASGIPARYIHDTVEVPAERFATWAGGFETARTAADFVASGGIPVTTVTVGGRIDRMCLEHLSRRSPQPIDTSRIPGIEGTAAHHRALSGPARSQGSTSDDTLAAAHGSASNAGGR